MKRIYVIYFIVFILFYACSGCEKKRTDILSIIPNDSQNVVWIPSVESLVGGVTQFFRNFESGVAFEALKKELDLASQKLGINLFDRQSVINAGFDPSGSLAFISTSVNVDGKQQNVNLLIMPYTDRVKAENTLNRLSREKEKTEIFKTKSYMDARIITAIRQGPKGEKPVLMYAFYKGYVIYGIPEKAEVAIKKIVDVKETNSIKNSQLFNELKNKTKSGQFYFFINSGKNIDAPGLMLNRELRQMIASIRDNFNGMMLSVGISGQGIDIDSFIGLSKPSLDNLNRYLTKAPEGEIEKLMYIVPEEPLFLAKLNLNFSSLYNLLKEENPYQMMIINKRIFGPMLKYMEVDVEKDILPLIKGSLIYAVSPGEVTEVGRAISNGFRGEAFNKLFNVFYSMSLTDKNQAQELLSRFSKSLGEKARTVDNIKYRDINIFSSRFGSAFNSYWFIDEGNFYAFYTDNKPEDIVRKPTDKNKRPIYKIPTEVYNMINIPSSQVIYISFSPFGRMVDKIDDKSLDSVASTGMYKFVFMIIKELFGKLDNMYVYLNPESDGLTFDISINIKRK